MWPAKPRDIVATKQRLHKLSQARDVLLDSMFTHTGHLHLNMVTVDCPVGLLSTIASLRESSA